MFYSKRQLKISISADDHAPFLCEKFRDVIVIIDPEDYAEVLAQLKTTQDVSYETRMYLAGKVYRSTAYYDTLIADYFKKIRQDIHLTNISRLLMTKPLI
jgi:phosphoribosylaminoimidazolecarboxamide formyltransferase/IMP cyclohydrolase